MLGVTTKKATPAKRTGESSHIPLDAVRDILFQLSKGTHAPDAIMARVMATRTQDPQAEIIRDKQDEREQQKKHHLLNELENHHIYL